MDTEKNPNEREKQGGGGQQGGGQGGGQQGGGQQGGGQKGGGQQGGGQQGELTPAAFFVLFTQSRYGTRQIWEAPSAANA